MSWSQASIVRLKSLGVPHNFMLVYSISFLDIVVTNSYIPSTTSTLHISPSRRYFQSISCLQNNMGFTDLLSDAGLTSEYQVKSVLIDQLLILSWRSGK